MLEITCYELDFKIAATTGDGQGLDEDQLKKMMDSYKEIKMLEEEIETLSDTVLLIHNAIISHIKKNPTNEKNIKETFEPRIMHFAKVIDLKVKHSYSTISNIIAKILRFEFHELNLGWSILAGIQTLKSA